MDPVDHSLIEDSAAHFSKPNQHVGEGGFSLSSYRPVPKLHLKAHGRANVCVFAPSVENPGLPNSVLGRPASNVLQQLEEVLERAEASLRSSAGIRNPLMPQINEPVHRLLVAHQRIKPPGNWCCCFFGTSEPKRWRVIFEVDLGQPFKAGNERRRFSDTVDCIGQRFEHYYLFGDKAGYIGL
jgi:hypothetical protein